MIAAAFILLGAAVFAFYLAAFILRLAVTADPLERACYEHETRAMGWHLSKRFPQGKDDGAWTHSW